MQTLKSENPVSSAKILLVGCGLQSYGAALDLLRFAKPQQLILADFELERAQKLQHELQRMAPENLTTSVTCLTLDAGDLNAVVNAARGKNLIVNTSPYRYAVTLTQAAIAAKVSLVDLGGDTLQVLEQLKLHDAARAAGITIMPDCGMGPGITNIVVGHGMELLDFADEVHVRDGGIPQDRTIPLHYFLLFAIETLVNEYTGRTTAVRDGKIVEIDSLTETEIVDVPNIGKMEATHGMGMLSTLPWSYPGRIKNMDNKFLRFPGHLTFISNLKEAGFFSRETIQTENGPFQPRAMTKAVLEKFLTRPDEKDFCIIQNTMRGTRDGKRYEVKHLIVDHYDDQAKMTSMVRTTGFTGSIIGQMILNGQLAEKGVLVSEIAVPKIAFFEELKRRGVQVTWNVAELGTQKI